MNLIVVDMQPCYHTHCEHLLEESIGLMEKAENIVMFWVGDGLSDDTEDSVFDYWVDVGLSPETANKIHFIEKGYGFFRDWMDTGVPDDTILKVLRYMIEKQIHDSRDLEEHELKALKNDSGFLPGWGVRLPVDGCLYIPDFGTDVFQWKDWEIFGGAKGECLPEIELWLKAHGINTTRLDHLSWG